MKTRLCNWAGCNKLTVGNQFYCPYHQDVAAQNRKASAFKTATRYADYNSPEWRALRSRILSERPYCEKCGISRHDAKLHVHHIVPVRYVPEAFLRESNLIVLCENCHRTETQREIAERRQKKRDR